MIQLDRHIEILLLNNDCVIVPGLGGFMAHHVCARYYADTQSFIPPTRQLGFNSQLTINDSLLAQSYIEAYDISYPEALRRIEDEVNELKQKIQNEGSCVLNDIGILQLNADGNIEFSPCEAGILTPNLYGLNHIDIKPLAALASKQTIKIETEDTESKQAGIMPAPQPIPQLSTGNTTDAVVADDDEEEDKYIKIRISSIRRVATAAAVVAILCLCAIPFGKLSQPQITKSYLDSNVLYNILPECFRVPSKTVETPKPKQITLKKEAKEDSVKVEQKVVAKVDTLKTKDNVPVEETKKPAEETKKAVNDNQHFFSIVLASKVSKTNGEAFIQQLKKSGFDKAEIVTRPNGSKVVYGRFKTESEAYTFLRNLRSSSEAFNEGWVMEF